MSTQNKKAVNTKISSSVNKNENTENNNSENKIKFSTDVLDALNALSITENARNGNKSIFKPAFNDKALRTKYRNMLIKISKVEIEGGKTMEVQKGLIPTMLMQIKKNKIEDALKTFSEISEICKKVYVGEDKFDKAEDYFSGNRSTETQNILKAFISVAQSLNA